MPPLQKSATAGIVPVLTPREKQVADLICRDYSDKLIATELGISVFGVRPHIRNLLKKYGMQSRAGVAAQHTFATLTGMAGFADAAPGGQSKE